MQPISKPALIALVAVWASISGFALWGEARLQANPTVNNEKILVRLVQPGITQQERKTFEARVKALSRLAQLSITKTKDWPTHLIWAETAVPDYLANEAELRRSLARIVPKNGALITGTPGRKTGEDGVTYTNSLAILSPSAALIGFYDKHHLVPFGEFVPLRGLLKAMPVATDVIGTRGDFTPGPGPRTMRAENFPSFSPLICYEAIFSGDVIDRKDPPEALLQITNDAWFGNTSGPFQHLSHARLRAIEEGLPLIRAANSGVSAVMDPMGRITASLPLNEVGVLDATIPVKLSTPTLFSRAEHTPALVFALFLMLSAVLLFAASRAKK